MSDGTPAFRFLDPETLRETGRIVVKDGDRPIENLNELEWVKGEVLGQRLADGSHRDHLAGHGTGDRMARSRRHSRSGAVGHAMMSSMASPTMRHAIGCSSTVESDWSRAVSRSASSVHE